jgi:formate hydrogenlyase subunit 6/NADH:ubiquinone oxidoreductase subunit I
VSWPPVMRLLSISMGTRLHTVNWPIETLAEDGPSRGVPSFDGSRCNTCRACIRICPAGCMVMGDDGPFPIVDAGNCVRCGLCMDACSEGAVSMEGGDPMAVYDRKDLVLDGRAPSEVQVGPSPSWLYRKAVDRGKRRVSPPGP